MATEQIGIFGDMHGNLTAFEATLAALRSEGIEWLVCLGDVAATGPQPREVVQRLHALGCPVVMGNTDDHILTSLLAPPAAKDGEQDREEEGEDETAARIREIDQWSAAQLSADERAYVAGFAPTVTVPLMDGGTLLCYHGSPRSYNDLVLPTTTVEELDGWFGAVMATVLVGGHTHQPMLRRFHTALLVNPGSVGLPFDRVPPDAGTRNPSWAEYAVLTSGDGELRIELRRARYDGHALQAAVRASGMPHGEWYLSDWDIE
jgi:predicted phosphodiesterase